MKEHKDNNIHDQKSNERQKSHLVYRMGSNKDLFNMYFTIIVQCTNLNPCLIKL